MFGRLVAMSTQPESGENGGRNHIEYAHVENLGHDAPKGNKPGRRG